jgi:diadenosine tetraphosphatase ApaH/serine/threonine PP2A family protein phosphatase
VRLTLVRSSSALRFSDQTSQLQIKKFEFGDRLEMEVDDVLDRLTTGQPITHQDIESICRIASDILRREDTVLEIQSPLTICGDVHGDFENLLEIFDIFGSPPDGRYLFLGDYVDRGDRSVETVILLLAYKIKYPADMFLIRGNHESTYSPLTFGFYAEIMNRFRDFNVWKCFMEVFKALPLAAVVDSNMFCVHGGLCPSFRSISQLHFVDRFIEQPDGLVRDILWSDPYPGSGYQTSPRQAGYIWGKDVTREFLKENKLDLLVRGHEQKAGGFEFAHDEQVLTVFSTPYYSRQYNEAAVLEVINGKEREITKFRPRQWQSLEKMMFSNPWLTWT